MNRIIELIKYGFWGVLTTLFNLAVFYIMVRNGLNYLFSNIFSYFLAVILSYFVNAKFVFQENSKQKTKFLKFVLIRIASVMVDSGLLYLSVSVWKHDVLMSKICISAIVILGTYIFNKLFVFKSSNESEIK